MKIKKTMLIDLIKNMMGFAIYMFAFQIIMMPFIAKHVAIEVNARMILYVSISNILSVTLGNELGILYQIFTGRNIIKETKNDIRYMLNILSIVISIVMFSLLLFLKFPLLEAFLLALTVPMTNVRCFVLCYLRLQGNYKSLIIGNCLYLFGILLGIGSSYLFPFQYFLPVLLGETFAFMYYLVICRSFFKEKPFKGSKFKLTRKEYLEISSSALLFTVPNYTDKMISLPLLGEFMMSAYYAGSVVANLIYLVINPINGVVLAWLSKTNNVKSNDVISKYLKINIVVMVLTFLVNLPMIYVVTYLFYRKFLTTVMIMLIPLALSSTFSISTSLLKTVYLRFMNLTKIKYFSLMYIACFITFSVIGALLQGLIGFSIGIAIAKFILWGIYFYALKFHGDRA